MRLYTKVLAATIVGSLASTSAFAQNNNTGEIEIQAVVPGTWEISVSDINAGYDFDLRNEGYNVARVGTVHVFTNDTSASNGILYIESANAGRMINNSSIPGLAGFHQEYLIALVDNTNPATSGAAANDGSGGAGGGAAATAAGTAGTTSPEILDASGNGGHDLVTPATVDFTGTATVTEQLYDVNIQIPATVAGGRATAAGVYTDVITFTIMDDQ